MTEAMDRSDAAIERLDGLLNEAVHQPTSAPYRAELIEHNANARRKLARKLRTSEPQDPRITRAVEHIEQAATDMLGAAARIQRSYMREAEEAWFDARRAVPWWRRMWMPTFSPPQFKDEWIQRERDRARRDIATALSGI